MGKVKHQKAIALKRMLMKEKSITEKKKREMDSYHEKPDKPKFTDKEAIIYNKTQVTSVESIPTKMFLSYNSALGPPFHILLDTNFINFSMQNKIEIVEGLMDCMLAKVVPCVCSCVMGELEKLGKKFRIALRVARDKRFKQLTCDNKYADDCIIQTVTRHRIYMVATCDQELKRRIRKIPGVPIIYIAKHRYTVERLPEVFGAST